jgi:predicted membrane channel-forming protein YqfA (hemolysin III family)
MSRLGHRREASSGREVLDQSFPQYHVGERIADGCVHVLGVGASIAGAAVLLIFAIEALPPLTVFSLSVYSVGLVAVFCCSAAYNLINQPRLCSPSASARQFEANREWRILRSS